MSMFKKGFSVAREENERVERSKESSGKRLFDFFLAKDGEEADVIFLTEEPINFDQHDVREAGKFKSYVCSGEDCPLCESGDEPKYKGAFLIWDTRAFSYKNKDGKEITNDRGAIRVYTRGIKDVTQLDRLSSKYGLAGRMITVIRMGSGQNTTYTFERGDKVDITEDEIRSLLPEKLQEEYNGTMESLYDILEEQLTMRTKNGAISDEDSDESEEEEFENDDVIIGAEEEKPKKKLGKKNKKAMFKSKK